VEYYISESEKDQIQAQLPESFVFAFENSDGKFVHSSELVSKWSSVNMDTIIGGLFDKTYEEFLAEKYSEMSIDPIYKSKLIEEIYKPIGEKVINLFMGRNSVDGISNEQSKHVVNKAKEVTDFLGNGAIPDAMIALATFEVDDMTETYHWLSQERINLVIADLNKLLSEL
jgi:hypothetical protein